MEELYKNLLVMGKGNNIYICSICLLMLVSGCQKSEQVVPLAEEYIVDIYNYFGKSQCSSILETISFENSDNHFSLVADCFGEYTCPSLDGQIVMYYPSIDLICMLCDPPTVEGNLYANINGSRYLVQPKKAYAIYSISEFFRNFIYLDLCPGDSLLDCGIPVVVQRKEIYEIIDVDGDFFSIRAAQYDEDSIPRIIPQPKEKIYYYQWRKDEWLNTSRFAIDE